MKLTKKEAELLSSAILNQMARLNGSYCVSDDLKDAIKKEVKELQKLHSKICEVLK